MLIWLSRGDIQNCCDKSCIYIASSKNFRSERQANDKQTTPQPSTIQKMNSTVIASSKHAYHTVTNAEFTGFFCRTVYKYDNIYGFGVDPCPRVGYGYEYHLFIKYGDKVYMDVKNVGEIVISFDELQKNKFWKYYYDLSLMLTIDKNKVVQDLKYNSDYLDQQIYEEKRLWSIDTAYIECDINAKDNKIINHCDLCYYKINPYDLDNMECASEDDLKTFQNLYMTRRELRNKGFDKMSDVYNNLVSDYHASLDN